MLNEKGLLTTDITPENGIIKLFIKKTYLFLVIRYRFNNFMVVINIRFTTSYPVTYEIQT